MTEQTLCNGQPAHCHRKDGCLCVIEAAAFLDGQAAAWDRQHTFPGSSNTKYAADCRAMAAKMRGRGD